MIALRKTSPAKHLTVLRVLAAIPLVGIGVQHLLGTAPIEPILEGAGFPFVAPLGIAVPVLEVIAGLLLVVGFYARPAALVSAVTMACAVYAHVAHDWADEPHILLPVAVFVCVAQVLWGGAGAFSADLAAAPR